MGDHEQGHDLVVTCDPVVDQEPFDPDLVVACDPVVDQVLFDPDLVVEGHFDDSSEADHFDESSADIEVGDHRVAASYRSDLGQVPVPS